MLWNGAAASLREVVCSRVYALAWICLAVCALIGCWCHAAVPEQEIHAGGEGEDGHEGLRCQGRIAFCTPFDIGVSGCGS